MDRGGYEYISPVVNLNISQVTATLSVVNSATAVFYKTSNNKWKMNFNVVITLNNSARTSCQIAVGGVVFSSIAQSCSASSSVAAATVGLPRVTGSNLEVYHANQSTTTYFFSGDVDLASKPTAYLPDGV